MSASGEQGGCAQVVSKGMSASGEPGHERQGEQNLRNVRPEIHDAESRLDYSVVPSLNCSFLNAVNLSVIFVFALPMPADFFWRAADTPMDISPA